MESRSSPTRRDPWESGKSLDCYTVTGEVDVADRDSCTPFTVEIV